MGWGGGWGVRRRVRNSRMRREKVMEEEEEECPVLGGIRAECDF